jgi:CheY-like chemotaxis protein
VVLSAPARPPTGPLVLVVEDEFLLALELELLLGRHGYRVLGPASTVAEALRLLEGATPDAALLDVNLRGEMVTPVAEALRALAVPFVLASAYDQPDLSLRSVGTFRPAGSRAVLDSIGFSAGGGE